MAATCLDLVRLSIKDLGQQELDEVLDQLKGKQARLIANGANPQTAAAQAGMDVAATLRAAAAIERRNAAINLRVRTEALDYLRNTWQDDPTEGVLSLIYGSPKSRFGSRASVNAAQDAQFRRVMGGVAGELEKAGLFDPLRRGELDRDIARAMWHHDDPQQLRQLPEQAVAIAKILRKWQEVGRIEANRHGAWIGKDPNYVVRQAHHPDKLAARGFDNWKADILPELDLARMFPDGAPENLDEWLHEAFMNLTTGVRIQKGDTQATRMAAFKGPKNLAKSLSQERVFHFKSPEAWFDYNTKYGFSNLREAYVQGLHRTAESTGLMQVLGTNPEANLDAIVTAVRARLSRTDPEKLKKFDASRARTRIDNGFKEVSGFTRSVASQRLATVGAGVRLFNTVTGLGGAVLSSVTDVPVRASALRHQGQSYFAELNKGLLAPIRRLVAGVGSTERKATLSAIGYFNEIAMGNLASRFSPDDNIPGRMQKAAHTFFKWNLLGAWTDEMRRSSLESMGRFFGEVAESSFDKLSERTRRTLQKFRIDAAEWDVIRAGTREEPSGATFLTPEAVRELPLERFAPLAQERVNALKQGLVERIQKREKVDERERAWIDKRAENLRESLQAANERLNKRLESIEGRGGKDIRELQLKLANLFDHLDTTQNYWDTVQKRRPRIGEMRRQGMLEARAMAESSEMQSLGKKITSELEAVRADLDKKFVERWLGKEQRLARTLERVDPDEAMGRQAEFDQLFTEANAALTDRIAGLDEKARERFIQTKERLGRAQMQLQESAAFWERARKADPTTSELRTRGVTEGRARESAKSLKSEVRAVTREIERMKKDLHADFIARWTDRQDDLVAFSEGVSERISQRAQATARDLGELEPQINRILDDTRESMASRVQQLYADEVNSAAISPDARTLATIRQGTQAGTIMGESLRAFWQFKSFGIAIMQRGLLREFYGGDKGRGGKLGMSEARGLALFMAGTMGFGYIAGAMKDLVKGREPRPIDNPKTWTAAAAQGGGFGIYGDFLFGEANRFGGGFMQTLGGPTVGKLEQVAQLFGAAKRGDDVAAQALKLAYTNTPYLNLFYLRTATDYLFLYEMQEAMNPGYLRRMERNMTNKTGQEWWIRPSEVVD